MEMQIEFDALTLKVEYDVNGHEVLVEDIIDVDTQKDVDPELSSAEWQQIADIVCEKHFENENDAYQNRMDDMANEYCDETQF